MRVLFLNSDLHFHHGNPLMMGQSMKNYGRATWNNDLHGQSLTLEFKTQKEYLAVMHDVALKWHLPLCRWIPIPVFEDNKIVQMPPTVGVAATQPDEFARLCKLRGRPLVREMTGAGLDYEAFRGKPITEMAQAILNARSAAA